MVTIRIPTTRRGMILISTPIDTTNNNEKQSPSSSASWVTVLNNRIWLPSTSGVLHHLAMSIDVNNNTGAGAVLTAKINNADVITIQLGTGVGYFQEIVTRAAIIGGDQSATPDDFTWQYRNFDSTIVNDMVSTEYDF